MTVYPKLVCILQYILQIDAVVYRSLVERLINLNLAYKWNQATLYIQK